jgi:hypothetical protein
MTDLVITATGVLAGAGASSFGEGTAGGTITAGKVLALDDATKRYTLADNNVATLKDVKGIALNGASNGQPVTFLKAGPIAIGATLVAGTDYYLSDTPGGICPRADLLTGEGVILIGLATSTSEINVDIQKTSVTL